MIYVQIIAIGIFIQRFHKTWCHYFIKIMFECDDYYITTKLYVLQTLQKYFEKNTMWYLLILFNVWNMANML